MSDWYEKISPRKMAKKRDEADELLARLKALGPNPRESDRKLPNESGKIDPRLEGLKKAAKR